MEWIKKETHTQKRRDQSLLCSHLVRGSATLFLFEISCSKRHLPHQYQFTNFLFSGKPPYHPQFLFIFATWRHLVRYVIWNIVMIWSFMLKSATFIIDICLLYSITDHCAVSIILLPSLSVLLFNNFKCVVKIQQLMCTGPCYVAEGNLVRAVQGSDNTVRPDVTPCVWPSLPQILLKGLVVLPFPRGVWTSCTPCLIMANVR